jgi:hypothetical protein
MPEVSAPIDLCALEGVRLVGPFLARAVPAGTTAKRAPAFPWLRCGGGRILAMHRAAF